MSPVPIDDDRGAQPAVSMLEDLAVLGEARRIYGEGGDDACVRARRFLDGTLQARTFDWRAQLSYEQAAAFLDGRGWREQAQFMRELSRVTPRLADTAQRWLHRYTGRAETVQQKEDRLLIAAGKESAQVIWDQPYVGIDGMVYTPGICQPGSEGSSVVLAESRGTLELISGFWSIDDARRWVRDERCAADLRPLVAPPGWREPRVIQEERVLSALLRRPGELTEVAEWLPATAFTADVRYEIFTAINIGRHSRGDSIGRVFGSASIDMVTSEMLRSLAWSPDWDNPCLGGPGTPLANVYLHRLASTPVSTATAAQTACRLAAEDARALLAAGLTTITHPPEAAAAEVLARRGGTVPAGSSHPMVAGLMPPAQNPRPTGPTPRL